jgi:hypothetical protein
MRRVNASLAASAASPPRRAGRWGRRRAIASSHGSPTGQHRRIARDMLGTERIPSWDSLHRAESRNPWDGKAPDVVWLDASNGHNSGQVLLGNALRPDKLRRSFEHHSRRRPSARFAGVVERREAHLVDPDQVIAEQAVADAADGVVDQAAGSHRRTSTRRSPGRQRSPSASRGTTWLPRCGAHIKHRTA